VVIGPEGGGNWFDVTVPDGAASSGAGRVESIDEKRVLEHPLAKSAVSARVIRPVFEMYMQTSATLTGALGSIFSYQHGKVAEFQPNTVKIGFAFLSVAVLQQFRMGKPEHKVILPR
jgi:hypothetical protein